MHVFITEVVSLLVLCLLFDRRTLLRPAGESVLLQQATGRKTASPSTPQGHSPLPTNLDGVDPLKTPQV